MPVNHTKMGILAHPTQLDIVELAVCQAVLFLWSSLKKLTYN